MQLKYAHLTDFATVGNNGKLILVGIFSNIFDALKVKPIPFPQFHLVAVFEAHVTEGTEHKLTVRFVDGDGRPVIPEFHGPIKFKPTRKGRPMEGNVLIGFGPGTVKVPEHGDYEFRFQIDDHDAGGVIVAVTPPVSG
ncbi:MAG: hypothetical protein Q8Q14_01415 [Gemmatimonadales bacterium]|nr:hypothetical protein [Gemmatimonadales bacterium]